MSKMQPEAPVIETALAHEAGAPSTKRKPLFVALAAAIALAGAGYMAYDSLIASHYIETDNAYTAVETAQVTPAVPGIVREVLVADTQRVKRGDVIVTLDDVDARLALAQAEAELGRAVRRVRGYVATDGNLAAQTLARASEARRADALLTAAEADLERARIDLARRQALVESGSVSGEELTKAGNAWETARANLAAAQSQVAQARAQQQAAIDARAANAVLIAGAGEDDNPEVALARARRDQARVNLERTVIRAPVDGVVAKRGVQVGQQVQAGAALLSVVPLGEVHVDANFKEVQLPRVRIGQPVELTADLYGRHVTYRGIVTGLSGGSGSAFAAIPAQNATGNWIKVVQRVPVRIAINGADLAAHPLQVGLSMQATIDTRS